jgi:mRNA-degrading endonuclease RelE of RelBE toxin-antitoxin system
MNWTVRLSRTAEKQKVKLSNPLRQILYALIGEIEACGPVRGDWPNYVKLIEVIYVGTHEKAPY